MAAGIFPEPRYLGVVEQYNRTLWLLDAARQTGYDSDTGFRMQILAVYTVRAIAEIMLEAVLNGEVPTFCPGNSDEERKKGRDDYEAAHLSALPFYGLISRIRIHDFHRFGCPPINGMMMRGPVKL